jgi:uncharacterized protein YndB with AHSA1/START domain
MNDAKALPEQVASIHIDVSVERVWQEITKTGRVQRALYNTVLEMELRPGARLRYYSPNRKRVFIVGEVVEVDAPHRLSHTYWFTMWKGGGPTLVTWELREESGGCRVTVTHSGWTTDHEAAEKTGAGWREILGLLKQELETGTIPLKTRAMYAVMNGFLFAMPKTTTTAYVDEQGW